VRNHAFPLQNASPDIETILPIAILRRRVFAVARAHQCGGIRGSIQRLFQMLIVHRFPVSQFPQKTQCQPAENRETVGIFFEVAKHVIVLGAEIIVASIFAEDQRVQKKPIDVGR